MRFYKLNLSFSITILLLKKSKNNFKKIILENIMGMYVNRSQEFFLILSGVKILMNLHINETPGCVSLCYFWFYRVLMSVKIREFQLLSSIIIRNPCCVQ